MLIQRNTRAFAAVGTMGGRAQPQILAQLIPTLFDGHGALADVLRAPRWVVGAADIGFARATVAIEADAPAALDMALRIEDLDVERIPARDERVGHAQLVRVRSDGALEAAADPRSDGNSGVF